MTVGQIVFNTSARARTPAGPWRSKDERHITALVKRLDRMAKLLRHIHGMLTDDGPLPPRFMSLGERSIIVTRIENLLKE